MKVAEWIALLLTLAFIAMILGHSAGVVNVEKWLTQAGTYLLQALTLQNTTGQAAVGGAAGAAATAALMA